MPDYPLDPQQHLQLRSRAESLLKSGRAPGNHGFALGAESLAVLSKLASSPAVASDCLKLLHELQTHQIELALQQEQAESDASDVAAELARYRLLYEHAPMAYVRVDREGRILDSNAAAAALVGQAGADGSVADLAGFLAPQSRPALLWLLQKLFSGSTRERCSVQSLGREAPHVYELLANRAPDGETALIVVVPQQEQREQRVAVSG